MKRMTSIFNRFILGSFLFVFYLNAFGHPPEQALISTTQQLINASKVIKTGKSLSVEQIKTLKKVAIARQKLLMSEFNHSNDVTNYVLSKQITELFPLEIKQYLENEVDRLKGKLEVRAEDYHDGHEVLQYVLLDKDEIYYLHFIDGPPASFETDAIVTVHRATKISYKGNIHHLVLSHKEIDVVNPKYALPLSLGPQKTLTFIVNFVDQPTNRPWTAAQITDLMYTTINNHFLESSYQQTSIVGQTAGWYVINVKSTDSCSEIVDDVSTLGNQAAENDGINLSLYNRKIYIFPKTSACGWAGLGVVGGSNTRSWINGAASSMRTPAHELGHNFGLHHSRFLKCSSSPNTGNCTRSEYGDDTDIMGGARTSHFNAYQKDRLGWLNYQSSPPITMVTTSGTYTLDAFETKNQNPKALKIQKREGSSDYYYLEYRQGIGFDAELANCGNNCDYTRGVVFHQGNSNEGDSSDLLDMSPNTSDSLVALLPGQQWTDPDAVNGGVTFKVVSADSNGAVINITFGTTPPPEPPTEGKLENGVPVANLSGARGDEKNYYLDVPSGKSLLTIQIFGGSGDADLYVRYNEKPTTSLYHCRPYSSGNNETCRLRSPPAGRYYIMLRGYSSYNGVTLVGTH